MVIGSPFDEASRREDDPPGEANLRQIAAALRVVIKANMRV